MTDHAHELRRYARKIAHPAGDVPAVMRAAADEIERLQSMIYALRAVADEIETAHARMMTSAAVEREKCAAKMNAIAHQCRMEDSDCEPFVYAAAVIRARGDT